MKYRCEVTIALPRERVIALFDDADNMLAWQPGLKRYEHLGGEPGQPGAQMRLFYDEGGRKIEMRETITRRELPQLFAGTYETKGVWNEVTNHFHDEGGQTRWVLESDFRFRGLMRLMPLFMGGAFRRQTMRTMERFRDFAEGADSEE